MENEPIKTFVRTNSNPVYVSPGTIQLLPTELHLVEDGSVENKTSFVLVLSTATQPVAVAQLTLKMLFDQMSEKARSIVRNEWKALESR